MASEGFTAIEVSKFSGACMNEPKTHRNRIGDSARGGTPNAGTDDLRALMAVYSPGLAIELELEAVLATPDAQPANGGTKSVSLEVVDGEAPTGAPAQTERSEFGSSPGAATSDSAESLSTKVDRDGKPVSEKKPDRVLGDCGVPAAADQGVRNSDTARVEPSIKSCTFFDETKILRKGMVVNVSRIDVLIKTTCVPRLGSHVVFSGSPKRTADVTRTFEIGFVARFCIPISGEEFSDAIQFMSEEVG